MPGTKNKHMNMSINHFRGVCFATACLILTGVANGAETKLGKVFKRVKESVVVIHTVERQGPSETRQGEVSTGGLGSGVLISDDGLVMTAAHVVHLADQVAVEFASGEKMFAEIIGSAPQADVALLRLEKMPELIRPAKLGDSGRVNVGDQVFVIGAPYGISHSLTVGHVSGIHEQQVGGNEDARTDRIGVLLQTDAAVNQGNSGGPLFNMKGEVIGIVSYILSQSGGFEGLGFAISSATARALLLDHPTYWSGLSGIMLTGRLAKAFNLPQSAGVLVQRVAHNSPAERAGIRPGTIPISIDGRAILIGGDIILGIDDITIAETADQLRILDRLSKKKKGDKVVIRLLRDGIKIEQTNYVSE